MASGKQGEEKEEPGELACGRRLRKKFGKKYFYGVVSSYDPTYKWYKVKYEDGDREELWWHEVEHLLIEPLSSSQNEFPSASELTEKVPPKRLPEIKKKRKSQSLNTEEDAARENADADTSVPSYDHFIEKIGNHLVSSEDEEIYGWGELPANDHTTPSPFKCFSKLLVPLKLLSATRHHLSIIDVNGRVFVYRARYGNIRSRCDQWEKVVALENKKIIFTDICGTEVDRSANGYLQHQEDQIPAPFYLVALDSNGIDHVFCGSSPLEKIRTISEEGMSLYNKLVRFHPERISTDEKISHLSVGSVLSIDEPPFVGYITNHDRVIIRGATKNFFEDINFVTGFTGKPVKIQCGTSFHAIILTDDGKAWTWGIAPVSSISPPSTFLESRFTINDELLSMNDFSVCILAQGSLERRKVIDVGCYSNKFVALTNDGIVHYWSHSLRVSNYRKDLRTPNILNNGPMVERPDKLIKISFADGVCAGVTMKGDLHTWRIVDLEITDPLDEESNTTPLGRREGSDTQVTVRGVKEVREVLIVPGSLLFVAKRKDSRKRYDIYNE